jgi:hypothetical protein
VTSAARAGIPSCDGDDPGIPSDEILYRRLSRVDPNQYALDTETGERTPTSAAFTPKPDEDGLSVYRHAKLTAAGLDASVVALVPEHIVFGMSAGEVRSVDLGVRDDAWPQGIPDAAHPRNGAHALIVGWERMSRGAVKRHARELAKLAATRLAYS